MPVAILLNAFFLSWNINASFDVFFLICILERTIVSFPPPNCLFSNMIIMELRLLHSMIVFFYKRLKKKHELKGQDVEKTSLSRKFPRPSIVPSLWDCFYFSKFDRFFGLKCQLVGLLKGKSVFIQSDPAFFFVTQPFSLWPDLFLCDPTFFFVTRPFSLWPDLFNWHRLFPLFF